MIRQYRKDFSLLLSKNWGSLREIQCFSYKFSEDKEKSDCLKLKEVWKVVEGFMCWNQIRWIYMTFWWCVKGRVKEHFIVWYKVLNNYISVLKEHVSERGDKSDLHEVEKGKHVKWWPQIYGEIPMNSKGPGKTDFRMRKEKTVGYI